MKDVGLALGRRESEGKDGWGLWGVFWRGGALGEVLVFMLITIKQEPVFRPLNSLIPA